MALRDTVLKTDILQPGDLEGYRALMDLFGRAFEEPDVYGDEPPSDAYVRTWLESSDHLALVARIDGKIVGGIAAYVLRKFEQERSELYIYDLAVDLMHRRKGVATRMIEAVKVEARRLGAYVIFVQADYGDDPAVGLYEKMGAREEVLHFDIDPEP